jgi:hypothetical protein
MRGSMRTGTAGTRPDADLERKTTGAHDAGHSGQLLPQKHDPQKSYTRSGVHSRVLGALLPVEHLPDADRPPCSPSCSADRRKRSQQ